MTRLTVMSAPRSKRTLNSLALQLYEDGIMSAIISMSFPCTMSAHNVYYVKCNVVLNNVIFDSCLFPHQHYDRHSFHARECCAIRQNVRGDKSSMAFNNHFAHYSLFSYSKSQGNSFSHTCCLYCPAYLTAVAFSDRTRHGMPDEMLI